MICGSFAKTTENTNSKVGPVDRYEASKLLNPNSLLAKYVFQETSKNFIQTDYCGNRNLSK